MQRPSPRCRSEEYSVYEISEEMFYPDLQRFIWRRHACAHPVGHQHGGRKPTETSVTEFCNKSVNQFSAALIHRESKISAGLTVLQFEILVTSCENQQQAIYTMTSFPYYPESFRLLLSYENYGFCYLNLTGISKFKYERKNEMNSGPSSKKASSCKWPISLASQLTKSLSLL